MACHVCLIGQSIIGHISSCLVAYGIIASPTDGTSTRSSFDLETMLEQCLVAVSWLLPVKLLSACPRVAKVSALCSTCNSVLSTLSLQVLFCMAGAISLCLIIAAPQNKLQTLRECCLADADGSTEQKRKVYAISCHNMMAGQACP